MLDTHWNLTALYDSFDDARLAEDMAWVQSECEALTKLASAPYADAAEWLREMLGRLSEVVVRYDKAANYAFLTLAVEATHEKALACQDKVNALGMAMTLMENAFSRRLAAMDGLDAVIDGDETLRKFRFILKERAARARHMLPEALEGPILQMQLTGGRSWEALRNVLDGTALVCYKGEMLPLPTVRGLAYDPDPEVRKSAYEAELAAYPAYENAMAAALNAIKGEAITLSKLKGYDSVLDEVLDISRMDRATLDAMMESIEAYLPAFRRYLKAKAKLLGHKNGSPFTTFSRRWAVRRPPIPTMKRIAIWWRFWENFRRRWGRLSTMLSKTAGLTLCPRRAREAVRSALLFIAWARAGC